MGTILARKRADGSIGYTASIRVKRAGKVVHRETETFDREAAAKAWMKKRETELAQPGGMDKPDDPTLSDVIDKYLADKRRPHGKTKDQVLRTIKSSDLGDKRCTDITSPVLIEWIKSLKSQPQTRGNYLSHLGAIFSVARPAWGYPLDKQAFDDARVVAMDLGLTGRSKERTRRPTLDELDKLLRYFTVARKKRPGSAPMPELIVFALFSTRRQEEITRITWKDLDRDKSEVIVRDMKNPGEKIGNDVATTLTPEAMRLVLRRPGAQDNPKGPIWPYNAKSVSSAFTRACQFLGIEDLHFHDLRHEGISRLFEMGWNIPHVACVSGHRTWKSLQRYTHIKQVGDKYKDWKWLADLAGE